MENYTLINILMALFGWLVWNFGAFVIEKDIAEEDGTAKFSARDYASKHWENWTFTFLFVPIVLGGADYFGLIQTFHDATLEWTDGFYLLPGPLSHWAIVKIKEFRRK